MKMRVVVFKENPQTGVAEKIDEYAVVVLDEMSIEYDPTAEDLEVRDF